MINRYIGREVKTLPLFLSRGHKFTSAVKKKLLVVKWPIDYTGYLIYQHVLQALWLYRRFLSLCWVRQFLTETNNTSHHSKQTSCINASLDMFLEKELHFVKTCLIIHDNDYEDFQAQAVFSSTYILWLAKVLIYSFQAICIILQFLDASLQMYYNSLFFVFSFLFNSKSRSPWEINSNSRRS